MLGYLHHAPNFLWLNVVKGKSHQANGVVVKSNLVAANINLKRPKLPHQASITWRGEEPHHSSQEEEWKVFMQSPYQIHISVFPLDGIFHQPKTCPIPSCTLINLTVVLLNAAMRYGWFKAGSQNLVLGCRKLANITPSYINQIKNQMNSDLFCIHQIHNMIKSKTDYPVWLTSAFSRKIYQVTKKQKKKKKEDTKQPTGIQTRRKQSQKLLLNFVKVFKLHFDMTAIHLGIQLPLRFLGY